MPESHNGPVLTPYANFTPALQDDTLRVTPYIQGWGDYEYNVFEMGYKRCAVISELLGEEQCAELVGAVEAYTAPDIFAGKDITRSAINQAFMVMSALRGQRPTPATITASFRQLRLPSIANTLLEIAAQSTDLAEYGNVPLETLPEHFNAIKYDYVCNEVGQLVSAVAHGDFVLPAEAQGLENKLMHSAAQPTFVLRALLHTTILSGDKNCVAQGHKIVRGLLNNFPNQSSQIDHLARAMASREREYKPLIPTVRMLGEGLPDAFRDYMFRDTLATVDKAFKQTLGLKRRDFEKVRSAIRGALSTTTRPEVRTALGRMAEVGGYQIDPPTEEGKSSVEVHEAQNHSQPEQIVLQGNKAPDTAEVLDQLAAMVDRWSDMKILGESHDKAGIKQAAESIEREITTMRQKGHKVPPIDVGRLEMLANLKDMWPGSYIVSGIFTGRRKNAPADAKTTPHETSYAADTEVDTEVFKSYIALVMPIMEGDQQVGDYVVGECLIKGRNATYVYLSTAGNNRHWTEVFGPKKKGVNALPGVKVIPHRRVGKRTAAQTTFEKLRYILAAPHEHYNAITFAGESADRSLRIKIGGVALKDAARLELPDKANPSNSEQASVE